MYKHTYVYLTQMKNPIDLYFALFAFLFNFIICCGLVSLKLVIIKGFVYSDICGGQHSPSLQQLMLSLG